MNTLFVKNKLLTWHSINKNFIFGLKNCQHCLTVPALSQSTNSESGYPSDTDSQLRDDCRSDRLFRPSVNCCYYSCLFSRSSFPNTLATLINRRHRQRRTCSSIDLLQKKKKKYYAANKILRVPVRVSISTCLVHCKATLSCPKHQYEPILTVDTQ